MPEYQLELKQIVEYPRCRIYRQFIRTLMDDRSIRVSGGSGLFYFTVLCSYANFRTSYKRIGGINYPVYPGEWVCKAGEITEWFRIRFQWQAIAILDKLREQHLITYTRLGRGHVIKFKIKGWRHFNTILDYNAPCQKDTGFFFLPVSKAAEIVSAERCSEMDIVLDLWMNTVYNDEQVQGSEAGPVVYMRNGTGSPLTGYAELAQRWGLSKATAGRILKKLEQQEYITLLSFPGRHGSVICLNDYLSTMFRISDVMIDKEEIAMSLNIKTSVSDNGCPDNPETVPAAIPLCVSNAESCVSNPHIEIAVRKAAEMLAALGVSCCGCQKSKYKLSPLSPGCRKADSQQSVLQGRCFPQGERFILEISCEGRKKMFVFELGLLTAENKPGRRDS
ncbi:MAG: MarR family transcriptional regulator [Oscillospiraceae bacterium]|jgi:hypothetical protein|nr:MarR family transcriptional regulator [Oscillospiraceae bacterium]